MCRDILNTCVRNTEEAEKTAKAIRGTASAGKAVWGMIEESALAKTFKKGENKKMDEDLLSQAKACLAELEALHTRLLAGSTPTEEAGTEPMKEGKDEKADELIGRAKAALVVIEDVIQGTEDPIRIEELFYVNDSITGALARIEEARAASASASVPTVATDGTATPTSKTQMQQRGETKLNGLKLVIPGSQVLTEEPESLETPRIDKGKRRAAPEPEVHEPVTSPNVVLRDPDEEDEGDGEGLEEDEGRDTGHAPTNGL